MKRRIKFPRTYHTARVVSVVAQDKEGTRKMLEFRLVPEPGEKVQLTTEHTVRNPRRKLIAKTFDAGGSQIQVVEYIDEPGYIYIFIVRRQMKLDKFTLEALISILQEVLDKRFKPTTAPSTKN